MMMGNNMSLSGFSLLVCTRESWTLTNNVPTRVDVIPQSVGHLAAGLLTQPWFWHSDPETNNQDLIQPISGEGAGLTYLPQAVHGCRSGLTAVHLLTEWKFRVPGNPNGAEVPAPEVFCNLRAIRKQPIGLRRQ